MASRTIAPSSDTKSAGRLVALVNGANAKERRQQEPGQQSTDYPNDNVEEYPLLRVCTHDEAGDPSEDAANDEP